MTVCRFFTPEEYRATEDARIAELDAYRERTGVKYWDDEMRAINARHFPVGSMWLCPWYHDPSNPEHLERIAPAIAALERGDPNRFLSIHYWRDWARIRPPIMVICPGGGHWCPDQGSSNGTGWTVTGEAPLITASPSIWVSQGQGPPREYHGFLQNGVFTPPL